MIAIIKDSLGHIVFEFIEEDTEKALLITFKTMIANNDKSDLTTKIGYFINYTITDRNYNLLFPKVSNKKEAHFRAKIFISAINQYNNFFKMQEDIYSNIFYISYHNTKNIAHSIKGRIEHLTNYSNLTFGEDKVFYINNIIQKNTLEASREVLALYKSVEQMQFEYDIIDYLKPGTKLNDIDFTKVKLHSLIVQSFYIYESEFNDARINVKIHENFKSLYCNFFTVRSAFVLIFENCLKYCLNNSEIEVEFLIVNENYRINLSMTSMYNSPSDIERMFIPRERGCNADKIATGSGYGLYIVKQLLSLNQINISFHQISETRATKNTVKYANNLFSIDIPKNMII